MVLSQLVRRGPRNPTTASPKSKSDKDPGSGTGVAPRSSFLIRRFQSWPWSSTNQPFQSGNSKEPRFSMFQSTRPSPRNLSFHNPEKKLRSSRKELESQRSAFLLPSNLSMTRVPENSFPTP